MSVVEPERPSERFGHFRRAREATLDVAASCALPPAIERPRQVRAFRARHGNGLEHDSREHLSERRTVERKLAEEALVGDDCERPEVRTLVDIAQSAGLLGAHVHGRSEDGSGLRRRRGAVGRGDLGEAEVDDLGDLAIGPVGEEDVPGFRSRWMMPAACARESP